MDVGQRLELFVDDLLVDKLDGAEMRLHHPQPMPLAESPISGGYMTVIKDRDEHGTLYRAWYRARDPDHTLGGRWHSHLGTGGPQDLYRYAESRDGHEWSFPNLNIFEIKAKNGDRFMPEHGHNNVVFRTPPFAHNFAPFLDKRQDVPSTERFKAVAGVERPANNYINAALERGATDEEIKQFGYPPDLPAGLYAFTSPDGIHWQRASDKPAITVSRGKAFDSQNVAFWSETEQQYVAYVRTWRNPFTGKGGQGAGLRTVSRSTSPDFINWSEPVGMEPNMPGEHLYTSQTHPYFRAPHIYIATPTRFMPDRGDSTDILFMSSRAGSTSYDRLFTEAFIRPGLDPARWGNRSNYVAWNVVPTGEAEMSIYHAKSGIRYVLRTDGFISIHAGHEEGEMLTRPLIFSGGRLILNVSTSAAGYLKVEIQDADGNPVPRFTLGDCEPIIGDAIEMPVIWKDDPGLQGLAGRPVRLRFEMKECDLYSMRFQNK